MDLPFEAVEASRQETPTQVAFPSPAATADALIGARVGNFRVVRLLGRGGMGSVYLGEHEVIGSKVAIKVLHRHLAADQGLVDRFYAEARAANLIGHENVVSIFDIAHLPPNDHYLVMEFLEGDTLASVGARGLPTADAVPILMQACDALGAAHARGVVHRDLKPENVFLVRRGQQQHFVKLVDFGIAKILSVASATMAGLMVGTPEFMAPEQWGGQEVDGRTDLYALGMIAYQLATGALPFVANDVFGYFRAHRELAPTPPRQLNPEVPRALEAAILKALAKDPADRFQTAAQFREALEAVLRPDVAAPAPAPIPTPISTPTPTPFPVRAEPLVPPPQPPPEPPPRRKGFAATLAWPDGTLAARLTELTRAGAYVPHDGAPPPLRTRLDVHFEGGGEAGSAEVVNHVNAAQAAQWKMPPGFGLQFTRLTPGFRAEIERVLRGGVTPPPSPEPDRYDDPVAAITLGRLRAKVAIGDPYAILELPLDGDCTDARARGRATVRALEQLQQRPLSRAQRTEVQSLLEAVNGAAELLGNARHRAVHDAGRANFRGVARCISAGLTVTTLEELRREYLKSKPGADGRAHVFLVSANAYAANHQPGQAALALEQALGLDPLNVELHQRYWAMRREQERRR